MKDKVLEHYENVREDAEKRLKEFQTVNKQDEEALFEELTFCVFAANSSADMAEKAVRLLKPVLHTGNKQKYVERVQGKVRFHTVRSKYLAENHTYTQKEPLKELIQSKTPRKKLIKNLKGIGMKEASHFLRNTGHRGYAILDKHIRKTGKQISIFEDKTYPNTYTKYVEKEQKMKEWCETHNLNIDVLDLALWSFNTGNIKK